MEVEVEVAPELGWWLEGDSWRAIHSRNSFEVRRKVQETNHEVRSLAVLEEENEAPRSVDES